MSLTYLDAVLKPKWKREKCLYTFTYIYIYIHKTHEKRKKNAETYIENEILSKVLLKCDGDAPEEETQKKTMRQKKNNSRTRKLNSI